MILSYRFENFNCSISLCQLLTDVNSYVDHTK